MLMYKLMSRSRIHNFYICDRAPSCGTNLMSWLAIPNHTDVREPWNMNGLVVNTRQIGAKRIESASLSPYWIILDCGINQPYPFLDFNCWTIVWPCWLSISFTFSRLNCEAIIEKWIFEVLFQLALHLTPRVKTHETKIACTLETWRGDVKGEAWSYGKSV